MGEQFVLGRTIERGAARARRARASSARSTCWARARAPTPTPSATRRAYADAIAAVGRGAGGAGPEDGHGISVKLSALSPRYEATQEARVWARALSAAAAAGADRRREHDINFTLDAEEADRLVLSLKLLERLAREPELARLARPRPGGAGLPEARRRR